MTRLREAGRIVFAGVGLAVILFVAGLVLTSIPSRAVGTFLVGWLAFPIRATGHMTIDWTMVGSAVVVVALLVGGLHAFFRLFVAAAPARRWAVCTFGAAVLMFVLGTAVTGVGTQLNWLAGHPWTEWRDDPYYRDFGRPQFAAQSLWHDPAGRNSGYKGWPELQSIGSHTWLTDRMHIFPIHDTTGRLAAITAFWRDPVAAEREGIVVEIGGEQSHRPRGDLADVIAEYSRPQPAGPAKGAP